MNFQLMIKGLVKHARAGLRRHKLKALGNLHAQRCGSHRYVVAMLAGNEDTLQRVSAWFRELPHEPPFPPGSLLHYMEGNPWHWYGKRLKERGLWLELVWAHKPLPQQTEGYFSTPLLNESLATGITDTTEDVDA